MAFLDTLYTLGLMALIAQIARTDFKEFRIPNALTFVLALVGISYLIVMQSELLGVQLLSAGFCLVLLWTVSHFYSRLRGRTALGMGDVKLMSVAALWVQPWHYPIFLLIASTSALIYVGMLTLKQGKNALEARIPFGPFIGFGLLVIWIWQEFF